MSEINAAAGSSAAQIPTLIVSRPCRSADAVMRYISEGDFPFFPIIPAVSCAEATRTAAGSQFGVVLINSPLCDGDGISLARTLARDGCAVLPPLILKDDSGAPSGEVQKIYAGEKTV